MRSRICRVWPWMSWLVSAAVSPATKTRSPWTTQRLMRGPGGWVISMRRMSAIASSPLAVKGDRVWPARQAKKSASVPVIDDALWMGVDAVGDERLVADDTEPVHPAGRDRDRHPWRHRDRAGLAVEPGFAAP